MLYHFCGKIVKRSGGKDATAACAYNTRSCVYDRTTGLEWNHTYHKDKAVYNHRYLPAEHPDWAEVQKDKKGRVQPDKKLRDTENVPFTYPGGIEGFFEKEVKPYVPDAWIDETATKIGYEISFTKYFYQPVQLRTLEEITADIRSIEAETDGLLDEIIGG